jgi:eukaryotic-like serine/threonine-protein kinase
MEVIAKINRGGFGLVEKVRLNDGSIVARKTFSPSVPAQSYADRQKLLKRFQREVKFQSSFKSNAICPVLAWDLEAESPWFTMPLAETTLAEEILRARTENYVPTQALADVLNGLEELHQLGFVHRDLKPQNVLLIEGVWKLTDFGLILPPTGSTAQLTSIGSAWGTPEYAAPEQSSEFHTVGPGADIYAFGCILHDIFGQPPRVPYAKQTAIGQVGVIIERCTEQRPIKRFVSVSALRGVLLGVLSMPPDLAVSVTASAWVDAIKAQALDCTARFEELIRFLRLEGQTDDRYLIFNSVDEDDIAYMCGIDRSLWNSFANDYSEWVAGSGFTFAYCDVLIQRLERIFQLGDLAIQAAVVLASAELAQSHNRWYVMRRVLKMCGPELSDDAAARLCIDIKAFEAESTFRACADGVSSGYDAYHPLIRDAISEVN